MRRFYWDFDRLGGLATTAELRAMGYDRDDLEVGMMHGKVIRVRKALWALPWVSPTVIAAQRLGGRLACISALEFHGDLPPQSGPIHIEVLLSTSGTAAAAARRSGAVLHWSRYPHGHRVAVDSPTAWDQYAGCAVAHAQAR